MNDLLDYYKEVVKLINAEYETLFNLSNDELCVKLFTIEQCINLSENKTKVLDEYLIQVYAIVKETARRFSEGNIIILNFSHIN